ncbi:MAG: hypothetical protein NZL88_10890, partial [Gaiellaceae bacterium]|nr:hypothetical protein [Gaiellaceae bacterium]
MRQVADELLPSQSAPSHWKLPIQARRTRVVDENAYAFEQVGRIALRATASGSDETLNGTMDEVTGVPSRPAILLVGRNDQDASDHCEGELEVQVDCKRADVPEPVPESATYG